MAARGLRRGRGRRADPVLWRPARGGPFLNSQHMGRSGPECKRVQPAGNRSAAIGLEKRLELGAE